MNFYLYVSLVCLWLIDLSSSEIIYGKKFSNQDEYLNHFKQQLRELRPKSSFYEQNKKELEDMIDFSSYSLDKCNADYLKLQGRYIEKMLYHANQEYCLTCLRNQMNLCKENKKTIEGFPLTKGFEADMKSIMGSFKTVRGKYETDEQLDVIIEFIRQKGGNHALTARTRKDQVKKRIEKHVYPMCRAIKSDYSWAQHVAQFYDGDDITKEFRNWLDTQSVCRDYLFSSLEEFACKIRTKLTGVEEKREYPNDYYTFEDDDD